MLPETRDFADSIANGIGEYTDAVKAARPEVGTFAAMFPKLSTVLSDAGQKLKNLGSAIATTFEIPDWDIFGSLAGKRFGFDFALLNAPQIPYLAKGAVLPANKPFLAMVGDQKHGTNVEAPLATIQEQIYFCKNIRKTP